MCDQMTARGPDDHGVVAVRGSTEAVLGARRLAIIDPTPAGHQPFLDGERGNAIVYNGMVFNHRELRRELEAAGERFASDCDTEVVLRAYGVWGTACVERFEGMFAFGVWDSERDELFLARDRLGIKPLYYGLGRGGDLMFASQVKALLASGEIPVELSGAGVESYLAYGAVSEPLTIIEGISALPAGHTAVCSEGRMRVGRYWSPEDVVHHGASDTSPAGLRERLEHAVARHLISDVPVGVFLSGGLDSSALAALAAQDGDLTTVSVTFAESRYDEAEFQQMVAHSLRCRHVGVQLAASELLEASDDAFTAMDQPTFDAVNTFTVARAAAETGLKVALSGLGADELFDGYGQVRRVRRLERARRLPSPLLRGLARASEAVGGGPKAGKASAWLAGELPRGGSHDLLRRHFLPTEVSRLVGHEAASRLNGNRLAGTGSLPGQVSTLDMGGYMKNVLLRDTDAMSMANSLEVRVPFLDHGLVEWTLGAGARGERQPDKRSLAHAVSDVVPRDVLTRRKQGFLVPIAEWMAGELRDEVAQRLHDTPRSLGEHVDSAAAQTVWDAFLDGRESWSRPWGLYALWRWVDDLDSRHASSRSLS